MKSGISYSAVVLTEEARLKLLSLFRSKIQESWTLYAHHMTMDFGAESAEETGKVVVLNIETVGRSEKAIAVGVSGCLSRNKTAHITIAVAPGSRATDSNDIEDWKLLDDPIIVDGTVQILVSNSSQTSHGNK